MSEVPQRSKEYTDLVDHYMDRYGPTLLTAVFLGWILVHQLKGMAKDLHRCVMNQRSMMTNMGIKYEVEKDEPVVK